MQFQGGRCGWVSGQEVDFYIESDFISLADVLLGQRYLGKRYLGNRYLGQRYLGQRYLAGTTSQPAAKEWNRTGASAGSMHVSNILLKSQFSTIGMVLPSPRPLWPLPPVAVVRSTSTRAPAPTATPSPPTTSLQLLSLSFRTYWAAESLNLCHMLFVFTIH